MSSPEPSLVTPATLRDWQLPAPDGGKEGRGQLLVVGGCRSTPGAVRLAGEASEFQLCPRGFEYAGIFSQSREPVPAGAELRADGGVGEHRLGVEHGGMLKRPCDAAMADLGDAGVGDRLAAKPYLTRRRTGHPGHDVEEGGLACPVGSGDAEDLPRLHRDGHRVDSGESTETLGDGMGFE